MLRFYQDNLPRARSEGCVMAWRRSRKSARPLHLPVIPCSLNSVWMAMSPGVRCEEGGQATTPGEVRRSPGRSRSGSRVLDGLS